MIPATFVRRPDGRAEPMEAWLDRGLEQRKAQRPARSEAAKAGWLTRRKQP